MTIKAEKISFTYPKSNQLVLHDISAEFYKNEIIALTGENGCGKTTFGKLILGVLKPDKGSISIDGKEVSSLTLCEVGRKIGYVMQNPMQQIFCTSVAEEVEYGLKNLGLSQRERKEKRDYYLKYFQLEQHENTFPFSLSQGEKQRLVLASVLAMQPEYLMLDEPTASLDVYRQKLLGNYLEQICNETGCGIIIISHDRSFIERFTHREIKMNREVL